jgi:hypothetical protein
MMKTNRLPTLMVQLYILGAQRRGQADFFFPNTRKTSIQLLLEAQQHMKYVQTTPLDDEVSSLLPFKSICIMFTNAKHIWKPLLAYY